MALHYLLDGYNIIQQVPELAKQRWEDGRAGLIKTIEIESPQGSVNNSVTIFFDGRPGRVDTPSTSRVKVIFTDGQSADDRIKAMVAEAPQKKICVVVTDDREIRYYVRALGAKILKVSEFLSQTKSHQDKRYAAAQSRADEEPAKFIPKTVEVKITAELEQIWLNKLNKLNKEKSKNS